MKVVVDANVFVSAAIRTGPPHHIVQAWLERRAFEVVMCPTLLGEIRETLTERPRMRRWLELRVAELYIETIAAVADLVPDPSEIGTQTRDSEDDYLIALARLHDAEFIVSGDRDLLEWEEQRPPVVTPVVFTTLMPGHSTSETG